MPANTWYTRHIVTSVGAMCARMLIAAYGCVICIFNVDLLSQFKKKTKGSVADANNYRRITILSCRGKLFIPLLNNRFNEYLFSMNIIGKEQAGFRKGY